MRTLFFCLLALLTLPALAQSTTSWKGSASSYWSNSANWTNGIPNSGKAAVIGDASYTGPYSPTVSSSSSCAGLTIQGGLTLTVSKNLSVAGSVSIAALSTLKQGKSTLTVSGNWTNNGTYTYTANQTSTILTGSAAVLSGNSTAFRKLTINANAVVTANAALTYAAGLSLSGTLVPASTVQVGTSGNTLTVTSTGTLKVTAATFATNYAGTVTLNGGSTVEYNSSGAQTIAALAYSTLRISGGGTRTPAANLTSLNTSSTGYGNIYLDGGILDLKAFTANRPSSGGGTFSLANGTKLMLNGSANFPTNFTTYALGYTSTVEYYGAAQTVSAQTYGNLTLSGSGATALPGTAFTVSNALSLSGSVAATANANVTVSNGTTLASGTSLSSGIYTLALSGGLTNSGTLNGGSGTVSLGGAGSTVSGAGTYNFYNLTVVASGISIASTASAISVAGNLATTGSGVLTYASGTVTMTGSGKTISGSNISLNNLTVSAAGSITASNSFTLTGNLAVSGTLATSGILTMSGASKTISGTGTMSFAALSITGSLSTASSFTITGTLDVTGSLTASAGTVTFNGTNCLYNGTSNLFNATVASGSLQLAANSTLGIAGALSNSGTFNTYTTVPNTVVYNSSGAQNVAGVTYDNLTFSTGGTKTAASAVTVNTDLTISAGTTFAAGSYTHLVKGNWTNNGTFTAGTSTVQFGGGNDATLSGASTFNTLEITKSNATNSVFLSNNTTASVLTMTKGVLRTGSAKITVPVSAADLVNTGKINFPGTVSSIVGTIERTHPTGFTSATDYAFESKYNVLNLGSASGVTNITVTVTVGNVATFPYGAAINRNYNIAIPSGTYSGARLRLHYEDVELNGNSESGLQLYNYGSSWTNLGASSVDGTNNYAEQQSLSSVTGNWTLSTTSTVYTWTGALNTDWATPGNWSWSNAGSPATAPTATDIVQIGSSNFTNQPVITSAATAKSLQFGSVKAATLTLGAGGSLTTQGNISGSWSANATHTLDVGAQTLTVNGGVALSDGTSGHAINLAIGSGTVSLTGSLTESGGANVTFSGAGNLSIGGDFTYSSGTFSAGSGTVTYNGGNYQSVGGVTYNQLVIDKTTATATTNPSATTTVSGNLVVKAGTFDFSGPTLIAGDVTVQSGAYATNRTTIQVGGNWNNNGTYIPNGGTATFNGTGNQNISATAFNKIVINKTSGTATLTGNVTLNSDLLITAGTLDMKTFTANRNTLGGTLQLADGAALYVGGSGNFPANYTYYTFGAASNTYYNGTGTQSVAGVSYGHLTLSNGGSNAKTLAGTTTVQGNLTISSGATVDGYTYNLSLYGNWTNNGSFTPSSGAVLAMGTGKTITGNTTFNKLSVYGSYTVAGSDITYNGLLTIVSGGTYDAGSGTAVLYGNLTNSGSLVSAGTTTFAGTQAQTLQLINAINSTSTGVINFNGTVAPTLNSTSTPTFATLNINNTGGITPSVNWNVLVAFNVAAGATFNTGTSTHTISGSFTNNGIVTGAGTLQFSPTSAKTAYLGANSASNYFSSTGTVNFGGSGALTVTGTPGALNNVVIGNSSAVSPSANWSSIAGTFTVADNGVFNAGSYTYTITGNLESNGTLNGGTSTFVFSSATAQISGSANTSFYDLLVNTGAALTINSEFNVSHDLTMNGTIDASLAGVTFNGSTNGNLTGSATTLTLADFDVEKTSGYTLTLQKNLAGVTDLNVTSGTLDIGTLSLAQDATAGATNTLTIEDYARLRIGGTSAVPAFTQYALDSFSIVEYNGTTQALTPALAYGSIEITAGTKTTSAALTLLKHLTITGGTFTGGAFTHNIGGDFTQTSPGVFTSTGTTLNFNGATAQNLSAASTLNIVTLNNLYGLSLGSAVTIGGSLALSSGKLTLGNYNLTVSSGNYTAGSTNYVVATGSGALVLPVAASGSKTFHVGTSSDYMPATVALTASSTADNISVRLLTSAQLNGSSGSNLSNYAVNATWMIDEAVAGGSNATVTLSWPASRELPGFARSNCRLAHYSGSAWDWGTSALSATGNNPYSVSRSGFTSFSPFSVRMYNAVLPVTWLSFNGQRRAGNDVLQWSTATESNNTGFTVEASSDGRNFAALAQVAGAGNSSSERQYSYTNRGVQGTLYYRVRQTDLDGRSSFTQVVRLGDAGATAGLQAGVATNPVRGNASVQLATAAAGAVQLALFDAQGRSLWQQSLQLASGAQTVNVPLATRAAGIYFLTIVDAAGGQQTLRLVKE